jgi:hypothetical protein
MPFYFRDLKKYDFDFEVLNTIFMQNPIFNQYEFYVKRWVYIFQTLDLMDSVEISRNFKNSINIDQYYEYAFPIENQLFHLQFNIDTIIANILKNPKEYPLQRIPLNDFSIGGNTMVLYTDEPGPSKNHQEAPIILAEFPIEQSDFIVIDGNHRITKLVNDGVKFAKVVGCHPMNRLSFMTNVDWAMYLFKLESYHLSCRVNEGEDFMDLIKRSNAYNTFGNII